MKSVKVDITHLAMEIDFQTSDHVVAMEKVADNLFQQQNTLNATVFMSRVILVIMKGTEK